MTHLPITAATAVASLMLATSAIAAHDRSARLTQLQLDAGPALTVLHRPNQQYAVIKAAGPEPLLVLDAQQPPLTRALTVLETYADALGMTVTDLRRWPPAESQS